MSDGGVTGGELDPPYAGKILEKLTDPNTYKGATRKDAQTLVDHIESGMSKEDRRVLDKVKRGKK